MFLKKFQLGGIKDKPIAIDGSNTIFA